MKRVNIIVIVFLLVLKGCRGNKQSETQNADFIIVDVTASYPKKELILQDFMDVEYIPLETNDDFLCQGVVLSIGEKYILVKNRINDGSIFIFDREGRALRKINRLGQGEEEYIYYYNVILDEVNSEILVNENSKKKILVYDLYGNFKRDFSHKENAIYDDIINYDNKFFIWWNSSFEFDNNAIEMPSFFITSKEDGSVFKEIELPFENRKSTVSMWHDADTDMTYAITPSYSSIISYQDQLILVEPSSDTIYKYLPDHRVTPFLVRVPSIHSMNPEVFLFPSVLTNRYYFMEIFKKEYESTKKAKASDLFLMYDRQEKAIYEYAVFNNDYSTKKQVYMTGKTVNSEIAYYHRIEADALIEAYKKGELKDKLKEVAEKLDEESNPVIMLVKHKK